MIAALYVAKDSVYYGLPNVQCWDEIRDARNYKGPHPVIAHPPCKRWGRFAHGSPRKPHQFLPGDDAGCFFHAVWAVRTFGGVLEHPKDSKAWKMFGMPKPLYGWDSWTGPDHYGGRSCYVEQGFYGHISRKPTWLYAVLPSDKDYVDLKWGLGEQRLDPKMVERYGYEYARKRGIVGNIGGKDKEAIRDATPEEFRDVLIQLVENAYG